ncbi:MAG: CBS domain-containing protein [Dehalococcoidia bacterium]
MEGRTAGRRRAISIARKDIPTCRADEQLRDVRDRVHSTKHSTCIVVNDGGVVLGRLGRKAWEKDIDATVEEVMALGPATVRPDVFIHDVIGRFQRGKMASILVTSYGSHKGGRFLGVLYREDTERVLAENEGLRESGKQSAQGKDAPTRLKISE